MLTATYDYWLVIVSLLVAILASYTALDMAGRLNAKQVSNARWWLGGGAAAMGTGIWAMHFVGMLAFRLPLPLGYDLGITLLSLLIAITASGFALWRISQPRLSFFQLGSGALLMGGAIAAMHYTGMAALRMRPGIDYDPLLFAASVLIAIAASGAALWIAHTLRHNAPNVRTMRGAAAVVMGVAIVGMHYTGMAAANFANGSICGAAIEGVGPGWLAIVVVIGTLAVLAIALVTSVLDARLESETMALVHSLETANDELQRQALEDHLTKMPNRTLLGDRLDQMLRKAAREKSRFAVMFIDLDGFKAVNDSLGHHVGDQLLLAVAERIRQAIRAQDTAARLGGDEFVILIECDAPEDAAPVADKLITAINLPYLLGSETVGVSASIGIAVYPEDGLTRHELMINADAAMYHTKSAGRNGYTFFAASMNSHAHHQLEVLQDLRQALVRGEFELYYQPKLRAPHGPVTGAEALLRWRHPQRGLVAPDEFIPLAEKSGLIVPIGQWVLQQACRQLSSWRNAGHDDWTVSVNLSAVQFNDATLLQNVAAALQQYDLPPHCLTLEITESTAMKNVDANLALLQQLVDLGVDISIDDFGTGYSSLLYLKRLPATELKIDRGFIRDLSPDTDDSAIVAAIVALGHSLGLTIIAEGVETDSQLACITALGCDSLQGFLKARPMPAADFVAAVQALDARKSP